MASNGVIAGNSDYSYLPIGWTVQQLVNTTGGVNLGYDVAFPGVPMTPVAVEAPVEDAVEDAPTAVEGDVPPVEEAPVTVTVSV